MLLFGTAFSGWLMGKPIYYHIHEIYLKPEIFKQFLRFVIQKSADKIIFVSKTAKQAEVFDNKEQYIIHNALVHSFLIEQI